MGRIVGGDSHHPPLPRKSGQECVQNVIAAVEASKKSNADRSPHLLGWRTVVGCNYAVWGSWGSLRGGIHTRELFSARGELRTQKGREPNAPSSEAPRSARAKNAKGRADGARASSGSLCTGKFAVF